MKRVRNYFGESNLHSSEEDKVMFNQLREGIARCNHRIQTEIDNVKTIMETNHNNVDSMIGDIISSFDKIIANVKLLKEANEENSKEHKEIETKLNTVNENHTKQIKEIKMQMSEDLKLLKDEYNQLSTTCKTLSEEQNNISDELTQSKKKQKTLLDDKNRTRMK